MSKDKKYKILGLMSGTSMDGLDMCLAEINIDKTNFLKFRIIKSVFEPFKNITKIQIKNAINDINISATNNYLGKLFSKIFKKNFKSYEIDAIALHGQTVSHIDGIMTMQIGNPKYLAKSFSVPIIFNFRQADIDHGGNGAPLMPFLDWLLFCKSKKDKIVLNVGGISNLTYIPNNSKKHEVIGFDTGPGMALIDEYCLSEWNVDFDCNAKFSSQGFVIEPLLDYLMEHPFINKKYPKSTGRHEFGEDLVKKIKKKWKESSKKDILRTFVAFTAKSIWKNISNIRNFSYKNTELIISGGGSCHPLLIQDLKYFTNLEIVNFKNKELCSDFKEAFLMSVLGACHLNGIPANLPSVTGAKKQIVLGELYKEKL